MARYLVTGGAGFIGSHLVEALRREGHAVRVLDDLSSGKRGNLPRQVELITADITDRDAIDRAFDGIDGCFHLAAIASVVDNREDWPRIHEVNLTGTINVFARAGCSRHRPVPVVYASTAAVYGDCAVLPAAESASAAPRSAYGADKRSCELHARVAGAARGVPTLGLRFFNVYGPRQDPRSPYSGVIAVFADRLQRGEPVEVFGDGEQVRDFVFVGDAVAALYRALPAAAPDAPVFNVCTGIGTTVRSLAETIAGLCRTRLIIYSRPARCGDVQNSIGDPSRAARELGFRAGTALAKGLAVTLDSLVGCTAAAACIA
ncbi:MAG TPA: NAD-dependent epimerase/dehydratase family protein [Stellaceae bacterium]|jgi:UDP-glucose 4-epimerase